MEWLSEHLAGIIAPTEIEFFYFIDLWIIKIKKAYDPLHVKIK